MAALLELRWEFTPTTLFEEAFAYDFEQCKIAVDQGVVIATLPLIGDDTKSNLRKLAESHVESLFLGAQVAAHVSCELSRPRVSTLHEDGSRGYIIECEPGIFQIRGGQVDIRYTRSDGTVVDTQRDRIEHKHRMSRGAATHGPHNAALARMLRSYRSAIGDTEDELIHLYEILDTLKSTFGTQIEALHQLGLSKKTWSRLGKICNDLPLRQGRHRGGARAALRDASEEELSEARSLSAEFIEAYVAYLERTK